MHHPDLDRSRAGFTLVELLIVVLIIGILATIAIPVFNGQRNKAKNAAAQSTLRNAFTAARLYYDERDNWDGLTTADLNRFESSVSAVDAGPTAAPGPSADPRRVWIGHAANQGVLLCAASKGDTSYCMGEVTNGTDPALVGFSGMYRAKAVNGTVTDAFNNLAATQSREW